MRIVSSVTPYVVKVIILLCVLQTVAYTAIESFGTPFWYPMLGVDGVDI